jgi:glutaredoxin
MVKNASDTAILPANHSRTGSFQMKLAIRLFFRTLRIVLIPFMLLWELLTTPKGIVRPLQDQQHVDEQTRNLVLYQFKTCPFCIKVRREIRRLSLNIELRDAQHDEQNRAALLQGGGSVQVPCLKISDAQGNSRWLYESSAINAYLHEHFALSN